MVLKKKIDTCMLSKNLQQKRKKNITVILIKINSINKYIFDSQNDKNNYNYCDINSINKFNSNIFN